jgi:nitroreductase
LTTLQALTTRQAVISTPRAPSAADDEAAALLAARYADAAPRTPPIWNEILTSQLRHRSVRAYLPDPLPPGALEAAISAAQSAASSSNFQLWSVVVVEDPARKARLADLAGGQNHIRQAPALLVWLADLARAERIAAERGGGKDNLDYLETFLVGAVDAALAAQNAVVALESLGLGTVYIGALRNQPEKVAAELELPPFAVAMFGLVVGRPDPAAPASIKPRLAQSAVFHRETYSAAQEVDAIEAYDSTLRDFQSSQGIKPVGWTTSIVNRVGKPGALNGRERLSEALNSLGFPLK